MTLPSRRTFAVGADICFKLSSEASALMVCTVPRMAFMVITARMTTVLSTFPSTAEMIAAMMRMITKKSANCSRKIRRVLFFPPSRSSLGPYSSSRRAAWALSRPWGVVSRAASRS